MAGSAGTQTWQAGFGKGPAGAPLQTGVSEVDISEEINCQLHLD